MPIQPSNYMNLPIPVVQQEKGPAYASDVNSALTIIDTHNHTSGQGLQVPTAGLNINADLSVNGYNLNNVNSLRVVNQVAPLTTAYDVRSVYSVNGDLYWNNGSGQALQITAGTAINSALIGGGIIGDYGHTGVAGKVSYSQAHNTYTFTGDSVEYAVLAAGSIGIGAYATSTIPANSIGVSGGVGIGTLSIANKLDVAGSVAIGSYAGTAGPTNGLIVSGAVGIGTSTLGSNQLSVVGTSNFSNAVVIGSGGLTISAGGLNVSGGIVLSGNITGNTNIIGTLTSSGALTTTSGGATITGNSTITGTLGVSGATTLSNTLGVSGATTLSSTLGVTGAATLGSTLGVTGNTTLSGTLGVTGATTLSSTLGVSGATTVGSTLGVTGATTMNSTLSVSGNTTIGGDIVATGGFKQQVGPFYSLGVSVSGATDMTTPLYANSYSSSSASVNTMYWVAPTAGSILAIAFIQPSPNTNFGGSGSFANNAFGTATFQVKKNGSAISGCEFVKSSISLNTGYATTFSKDTYPFAAGDIISVSLTVTNTGVVSFGQCYLTVEC